MALGVSEGGLFLARLSTKEIFIEVQKHKSPKISQRSGCNDKGIHLFRLSLDKEVTLFLVQSLRYNEKKIDSSSHNPTTKASNPSVPHYLEGQSILGTIYEREQILPTNHHITILRVPITTKAFNPSDSR